MTIYWGILTSLLELLGAIISCISKVSNFEEAHVDTLETWGFWESTRSQEISLI